MGMPEPIEDSARRRGRQPYLDDLWIATPQPWNQRANQRRLAAAVRTDDQAAGVFSETLHDLQKPGVRCFWTATGGKLSLKIRAPLRSVELATGSATKPVVLTTLENAVGIYEFPIDKPDEVDSLFPADQLDELLRASDIVILTLPLNEDTRGLFNTARFRANAGWGAIGCYKKAVYCS